MNKILRLLKWLFPKTMWAQFEIWTEKGRKRAKRELFDALKANAVYDPERDLYEFKVTKELFDSLQ